tara:strand:- start:827 stop:1198 length:372 start_codon:yes stop_codon:yes gene_type:complete
MKNRSGNRGLLSFLTRTRKKSPSIKFSSPKDRFGNKIKFGEQSQLLFKDNKPLLNLGPRPITNDPRFAHLRLKTHLPLPGDPRTIHLHNYGPYNPDEYGKGKKSKRRRPTKRRPTKRRKSKKR